MDQTSFLDRDAEMTLVNVATVPHRSLFRYPGGKTWLVPRIRTWLQSLPQTPAQFIEPFTGGGIIGLTVAFERLADSVLLMELDRQVAAVWHTVLGSDAPALAERIGTFQVTAQTVAEVLDRSAITILDEAFATILRNRVNRGGILAHGAGRLKEGEKGKGLTSRWYPDTLQKRILAIAEIQERVHFMEVDALSVLPQFLQRPDVVFFVDPPYTAGGKQAGKRLYNHSAIDHERLFALMAVAHGDFLMTYDNAGELHELAATHNFDVEPVAMKNAHHAEMTELLIGRSLDWARR